MITDPFNPQPSGTTMPQLSLATGIPQGGKKRTRRGKGGRGGGKKFESDPATHLAAAGKALASGDMVAAKKHAWSFTHAVHATSPTSASMGATSSFPGGIQSTGVDSPPSQSVAGAPTPTPSSAAIDPVQVRTQRLIRALHGSKRSA